MNIAVITAIQQSIRLLMHLVQARPEYAFIAFMGVLVLAGFKNAFRIFGATFVCADVSFALLRKGQ